MSCAAPDAPVGTAPAPQLETLRPVRAMTAPGRPNFRNRTVWTGDNLDILRGMNSESVELVYLDPPFNSNKTYSAPIGSKAAGAAFKDTWTLDDVDEAWHGEIAEHDPGLYAIIGAAGLAHGKSMKSSSYHDGRSATGNAARPQAYGLDLPVLRPDRERLPADAHGRRFWAEELPKRNHLVLHRSEQHPPMVSSKARHDSLVLQDAESTVPPRQHSHPLPPRDASASASSQERPCGRQLVRAQRQARQAAGPSEKCSGAAKCRRIGGRA